MTWVPLGRFKVRGPVRVIDPAYADPVLGVTLPDVAPGKWTVGVREVSGHRALRASHPSRAATRWEVVEPMLTTDSAVVGIYDLSWLERGGRPAAEKVDGLVVGGAHVRHCYDPWRCQVEVGRDGEAVVAVQVVWFSGTFPERTWASPEEPVTVSGTTLRMADANGDLREHVLTELYWNPEAFRIPDRAARWLTRELAERGIPLAAVGDSD